MCILARMFVVVIAAGIAFAGPSRLAHSKGLVGKGGVVGFMNRVEKTIALGTDDEVERFARVRKLAEKGQRGRAVREIQAAARLAAGASRSQYRVPMYSEIAGELLMEMKDYQGAERVLERALAQLSMYRPEIGAIIINQASAALYRETQQRARQRLQKARQELRNMRPTLKWVNTDMPSLELAPPPSTSREAVEADKIIREWMSERRRGFALGGDYGEFSHMLLGQALTTKGNAPEAVIELLAAVEAAPNDAIARYSLGWAYLTDGRLRQAAAAFREACRLGDAPAGVLAAYVEKSWVRFKSRRPPGAKQ